MRCRGSKCHQRGEKVLLIDSTYALEKSHPDLTGLKAHGDARMQSVLGKIFLHRVAVDL